MNKRRFLSFVFLFIVSFAIAAHSQTFAKKLPDVGWLSQTIRTNDGGYLLVINDTKNKRIVLRKIHSDGKKVWQRKLFRNDHKDFSAIAAAPAMDGGFLLTTNRSEDGLAVLKLNPLGKVQWTARFSPGNEFDYLKSFNSIVGTPDGGGLAAGTRCVFIDSCGYFVLAKLSGSGALEWSKTLVGDISGFDTQLSPTSDGGFIAGNWWTSTIVLMKLDSSARIQWYKSFTKKGQNSSWRVTPDGGVQIVFFATNLKKERKILMTKLDAEGNVEWKKGFAFENFPVYTAGLAENVAADGSFLLAGSVLSTDDGTDVFVARAGADGEIQSVVILGSSGFDNSVRSVHAKEDGGALLFGNLPGADPNVFFSSMDSSGNMVNCSLLTAFAKPIKRTFGTLESKSIAVTEGTSNLILMNTGAAIRSKSFKKKAFDFCPNES